MQINTSLLDPDVTVNKDIHVTHDKDLVQLAGYHAYEYRNYKKTDVFQVNGKEFMFKDTFYDEKTGLDALTVLNVESDELTVVFVGSEQLKQDWLQTNPPLLGDMQPAQIKAAKDYFVRVNNEIGKVSSVTGNSLAGALTNAVAIVHPDVKAVTLNPAILPDGMIDPNMNYTNITNYYSKYDFLTKTQDTLWLDKRIPGNKYSINNGLPLFAMMGSNHTGYVERDMNGDFTVEIGVEGEAGHGFIHVGADDHIVTSIWTGTPLYGGPTGKIKITKANMLALAEGIQQSVKERLTLAGGYLDNSMSIVQDERDRLNQRITELQEAFQILFNELAGDPMFNGIADTGNIIKSCIDELISLLNKAEEKCRVLNSILNSRPFEIAEHLISIDFSVETIFAPARKLLQDLKTDVDHLVSSIQKVIVRDIPDLFKGGKDLYVDAVTGELNAHYSIIQKNKNRLLDQITDYGLQVEGIANAFHNKDSSIAGTIKSKGGALESGTDTVQKTAIFSLENSSYLKNRMKIKELQVNYAHKHMKSVGTTVVLPVLLVLEGVLITLELALQSILTAINSTLYVTLYGNPVGLFVSIFSNYDKKIKAAVSEAKQPIVDMENTITGLRKGFGRMIIHFPGMMDDFKPYIDTAIFEPGKFADVRVYNIAASAILDEMDILFQDIIYQLSGEEAQAIHAALEVSENVRGNMQVLNEQVDRGTL